jgi:hypothetical protein
MKTSFSFWIKFSLINLFLVATLGLLMRYKIIFELPFINQKNVQHSHSHFAFAGWVTQTLFVLMVRYLSIKSSSINIEKYSKIFIANLICAYVMLFSFIFQGYGFISILFSTLSIFVSFWFAFFYFKDLKKIQQTLSKNWFKAALFFNILSSFGTFALAYMIATKNVPQDFYLSSIYFYLHFQYNGWFWFACMGLLMSQLKSNIILEKANGKIFILFALSCVPAYLLSVLWLKIPIWLYSIAILSAILQIIAWIKFIKNIVPTFRKNISIAPFFNYLYIAIIVCICIKFILQLGSTIPSVGKLAFGFRPIIIAYLHLVLLAIISSFLLVYIYTNNLIQNNKKTIITLAIFIFGIFANELLLAIQGIAAFSYTIIPYINEMLFVAALILFVGMLRMIVLNSKKI